ncbi:glycosyltransferase [Namhaeicola litoreus]|uniref:Glycosyltransferase n=1 Tax=Namhaeicola litoreus TaxID=1052145 RepID=A0ABW3Y3Q9_9FLAO
MEKALGCDFYFGNNTYGSIKKMDYVLFNKMVIEFPFKIIKKPFYYLQGESKLSNLDYNYYIITGQPYDITAWILIIKNFFKGKRTYIWNHGFYGKETGIQLILKKLQAKLVTGYFLYGNYAKDLMLGMGIPQQKLKVVYNSLDYQKQFEVRKTLKHSAILKNYFNNSDSTLLFIGRLTQIKKLDLLLDALHRLNSIHKPCNLIIIGEGSECEKLRDKSERMGLSNRVWFYGACYDESILGELIYNSDLCVSPGNVGLTAIHSMGYGTPVITHDNFKNQMPEFEVIVKNKTGSFFSENNLQSLVNVIENWITMYPKKSDKVMKECFDRIDRFYNPHYQIKIFKETLFEDFTN